MKKKGIDWIIYGTILVGAIISGYLFFFSSISMYDEPPIGFIWFIIGSVILLIGVLGLLIKVIRK